MKISSENEIILFYIKIHEHEFVFKEFVKMLKPNHETRTTKMQRVISYDERKRTLSAGSL